MSQAIIHHSDYTAITFNGKPSDPVREQLRAKGFEYKGASRWVRTRPTSACLTEQEVLAQLTAE